MNYTLNEAFSNIKIIKKRAINDTTLQKMPYFCNDFNLLKGQDYEKNANNDADAGMWNDHGYGTETGSDQI